MPDLAGFRVEEAQDPDRLPPRGGYARRVMGEFPADEMSMTDIVALRDKLAEGIRFERRMFHSTFAMEDRKEGMAAFAEKRKAEWRQR